MVNSVVGQGTTFAIYLPLSPHKAAEPLRIPKKLPMGSERILFVDDETTIADMSRQRLRMLGYNVTAVNNSRKALRLLAQTPDQFDLLITDMTMPNMSGDRLAVEAKKIKPQIPIILCTGFSKKMSKEKARAIGIDAFLMKPVALEDMAETIRVVLG